MEKRTEDWTCTELSQWLNGNGVPDIVCEKFEGKEISCFWGVRSPVHAQLIVYNH